MNHKDLMSEFSFISGNFPAINVSQISFQTEKNFQNKTGNVAIKITFRGIRVSNVSVNKQ
jgi:hypothetical protein